MQKTRKKILEYLREHGEATVDELREALDNLTAVTVRHHLDVLRTQELITKPEIQHRHSPGRPKYVYRLSDKADAIFPKNVGTVTGHLLAEIADTLSEQQANVIFEGLATRMAADASNAPPNEPFEDRLDRVIAHLSDQGYDAYWEEHPEGAILHTVNCPYSTVTDDHSIICEIDIRYISHLLGTVPRRIQYRMEDAPYCSYLVIR